MRLCTDNGKVVEYWNAFDGEGSPRHSQKNRVAYWNILDDFEGEAREVATKVRGALGETLPQ